MLREFAVRRNPAIVDSKSQFTIAGLTKDTFEFLATFHESLPSLGSGILLLKVLCALCSLSDDKPLELELQKLIGNLATSMLETEWEDKKIKACCFPLFSFSN